jgi:hypothetical protein
MSDDIHAKAAEYYDRRRREILATLAELGRAEVEAIDAVFSELIHEILAEMGGIKGFVRNFLLDYVTLKPGDKNRIKMNTDLLKLVQQFDGKAPEDVPAEQLEALETAIQRATEPSIN